MARTTLKPAIRNGLTAFIVALVAANVAVIVVRHGRNDRTRVSVAPAPSTTVSPTTVSPTTVSPTTETTVTSTVPPTTVSNTTVPPTTVPPTTVAPTTSTADGLGLPADAGATTTSTAPATTTPGAITVPVADPSAVPALTEHPHTGGHPLPLLALILVAMGLAGLRFSRRTRQ